MEKKSYYKINDVTEFTGETPSTLRYWENKFPELKPLRGGNGRRYYSASDIDVIRKIQFLIRTKGMHITAAKEQLHKNNKNISTRSSALQELYNVKEGLENLLQSLTKVKNNI